MKRELATYCLQLGDHRVLVDAGSRAEGHWLGLGYSVPGSVESAPVESPVVVLPVDEVKQKRRGRKLAVEAVEAVAGGAAGVTVDE